MFYGIIVNISFSKMCLFAVQMRHVLQHRFRLGFTTDLPNPACHIAAGFWCALPVCTFNVTSETFKMPQSNWAAYLLLQDAALSAHLLCAYSNGLLKAGFSALAIRWSRCLKAIHISDWMERCHRSWQPLTTHFNFSVAAEPSCVPPHLRITHFFPQMLLWKQVFFFFFFTSPTMIFLPTWLSFVTQQGFLRSYFSGGCAFSFCRHCRIWHLSLYGINYWSSALRLLFSWMLRILWYL